MTTVYNRRRGAKSRRSNTQTGCRPQALKRKTKPAKPDKTKGTET